MLFVIQDNPDKLNENPCPPPPPWTPPPVGGGVYYPKGETNQTS
jgi:hypothetical protein